MSDTSDTHMEAAANALGWADGLTSLSWEEIRRRVATALSASEAKGRQDGAREGMKRAAEIIRARLPIYSTIGQQNALRECISSILSDAELGADQPEPRKSIKIKPLVWREHWSGEYENIPTWRGENPLGIHVGISFAGKYKLEKHADAPADELAERKAAAQADFEARILSNIDEANQ